jgi:6-phospho-beta-glucosidase
MMHQRYFWSDVQCRGHYPAYALKMFETKKWDLDITEEDKKDLAAGTVDYIGFSYYMTNTVDSQAHKDVSQIAGWLFTELRTKPIYQSLGLGLVH